MNGKILSLLYSLSTVTNLIPLCLASSESSGVSSQSGKNKNKVGQRAHADLKYYYFILYSRQQTWILVIAQLRLMKQCQVHQ